MPDEPTIFLREHFERLLDALDKRYEARFVALKELFEAAVLAQKEAMNAALNTSDKAVAKAEDAQRAYNERSNEFRGQLDDQAKLLMARTEALTMFQNRDEKLSVLAADVQLVKEAISKNLGVTLHSTDSKQQDNWRIGVLIAAVGLGLAILQFVLLRG